MKVKLSLSLSFKRENRARDDGNWSARVHLPLILSQETRYRPWNTTWGLLVSGVETDGSATAPDRCRRVLVYVVVVVVVHTTSRDSSAKCSAYCIDAIIVASLSRAYLLVATTDLT